jgi:hypothetical protein
MATTNTALQHLQEIPLPPEVGYTPQTIGWLMVAALLLMIIAYIAWRLYRRHLAGRYRREALAELATIEAGIANPEFHRSALAALPSLVKRTALAFAPREKIAALSDAGWLAFLDKTYPAGGFSNGPGQLLVHLAYGSNENLDSLPEEQIRALRTLIRSWISTHHAAV